jgi:signal transduction histidine kinase
MLVQVVAHLLDNALKFSEPSTTIDVSIGRHGDRAHIVVQDKGIGLPEGVDVFAPFQRAPGAEARQTPGVGLGLHIVRNLVDAMNGEVLAESEPDRGAKFTVSLPLA